MLYRMTVDDAPLYANIFADRINALQLHKFAASDVFLMAYFRWAAPIYSTSIRKKNYRSTSK